MIKSEIEKVLPMFTGTSEYFLHKVIGSGSGLTLTDGANFVRINAKCHWLFDEIYFALLNIKGEDFLSLKMEVSQSKEAVIKIDDGNGNILFRKTIEYTDFPLDEIDFYIIDERRFGRSSIVVMLPNEY